MTCYDLHNPSLRASAAAGVDCPSREHEGQSVPRIHQLDRATIVETDGQYEPLNVASVNSLREVLFAQVEQAEPPWLVVDLSRTNFFGSNFIEVLFRAYKRLKERDGRMVLCGLSPFCTQILRATRLDQIWDTYPTADEAAAAVCAA